MANSDYKVISSQINQIYNMKWVKGCINETNKVLIFMCGNFFIPTVR